MTRTRTILLVLAAGIAITVVTLVQRRTHNTDASIGHESGHVKADDVDRKAVQRSNNQHSGSGVAPDVVIPGLVTIATNNASPILVDVDQSLVDSNILNEYLSKRSIQQYRVVTVDAEALRQEIRDVNQDGVVEIALFDEDPVRLIATDAKEYHSGWQSGFGTWTGKVDGDEFSTVLINVSPDGSVNGTIRSPTSGRIKLESIGPSKYHLLWKKDPNVVIKLD